MWYCLAQIVLAARGDDAEGWMNTLVIVLLAVFWAIGGILKVRARKAEKAEAEDEEPGVVKGPLGPLRPTARRATAKPVYGNRGVAVWRPQPQRIRAGAKTLAEGVEPRQAKPSVTGRKAREPKTAVAKMAGVVRPPKAVPAAGAVRAAVEKPMLEQLLLSAAEEPDELRKAILHYEILGKPLSLREPVDDRLR